MTSNESIDTINQLPDKVLGAIFDYLDEEEVKNASLVCSRWNHIIFHSPYIERFRLMLHDGSIRATEREMLETIEPNLVRTSTRKQKQMKRKVQQQIRQQALKEVLQSRRCYRSIYYYMHYDFALQSMASHRLQHIQKLCLDLSSTCFTSLDIWITFANVIPLMKQLHTIYIETYSSDGVCAYNVAPIVSSASVKLLSIDYDFSLTANMPALETYKGPLDALHRLGPNMPRIQFDKMQKLTIRRSEYANKWTANDYREFFGRLPNLQTIKSKYNASGNDLFTAMCETCSTLQGLVCWSTDISSFNLLTKLSNLRRIQLYGSSAPAVASLDLSALSNLEQLDLGDLSVKRSFIHNLPQSVTNLKLRITPQNERSLMRAITSSMTQLKELRVELNDHFNVPNYSPTATLRFLPLLKRLELFEFKGGYFGESCLLDMNTPMHRLQKLRFSWCQLDTKQLKGLHEKFPKLKELGFEYCRLKSGDSIDNGYQRF